MSPFDAQSRAPSDSEPEAPSRNCSGSLTSSIREKTYSVAQIEIAGETQRDDSVAVEEPMEIRVVFGAEEKRIMRSLSITMRTPGNDEELAAGFLKTEGILSGIGQIEGFKILGTSEGGAPTGNIIRVDLQPDVEIDFGRLQRNFFTTSSCGVCGKASLESLEVQGVRPVASGGLRVTHDVIHQLPQKLRADQPTFARTGGLHAAAICTAEGKIAHVREDIGRHNAVDKLIGRCFFDGQTPLSAYIMMISGRASFEIMQKAVVAGVPIVVAVGAPSSLAIDMAKKYNMTLVGFASAQRFNIYSGAERIA